MPHKDHLEANRWLRVGGNKHCLKKGGQKDAGENSTATYGRGRHIDGSGRRREKGGGVGRLSRSRYSGRGPPSGHTSAKPQPGLPRYLQMKDLMHITMTQRSSHCWTTSLILGRKCLATGSAFRMGLRITLKGQL